MVPETEAPIANKQEVVINFLGHYRRQTVVQTPVVFGCRARNISNKSVIPDKFVTCRTYHCIIVTLKETAALSRLTAYVCFAPQSSYFGFNSFAGAT